MYRIVRLVRFNLAPHFIRVGVDRRGHRPTSGDLNRIPYLPGALSGAFEEKAVNVLTEVNTRNEGENAPDAYYSTKIGKNSIGYFVFGKKATVVVNGDGSWSAESGTDDGTIDIAADGTSATVKATIEGSDANGQRAKPLTIDLVTKCGLTLPTTIAPTPVNTKQNVTEVIVEQTDARTTPS